MLLNFLRNRRITKTLGLLVGLVRVCTLEKAYDVIFGGTPISCIGNRTALHTLLHRPEDESTEHAGATRDVRGRMLDLVEEVRTDAFTITDGNPDTDV